MLNVEARPQLGEAGRQMLNIEARLYTAACMLLYPRETRLGSASSTERGSKKSGERDSSQTGVLAN